MIDISLVLTYIMKILGCLFAGFLISVVPKIKTFLDSKLDEQQQKELKDNVKTFVKAADKMYKAEDPTGEVRKAYVEEQLVNIGTLMSGAVNALIEEQVFNLGQNKENDSCDENEVEVNE